MNSKLLTISIPTYNRAKYLKQNLDQLKKELESVDKELIEILVSDNHSQDDTSMIVESFQKDGFEINYFRNKENLGWGGNFLQCFNFAQGKYVLILGDDDLLVDGSISIILKNLSVNDYGLVCVRAYGFNSDFRREFPGLYGTEKEYDNVQEFLLKIGALMTMISSCIINKSIIKDINTDSLFCGDLAALHLALLSSLAAKKNFFIDKPLVACMRNNSSNYNFSQVFVKEFWFIVDSYRPKGLESSTITALENHLLFSYYPHYILLQRLDGTEDYKISLIDFKERFGGRWQLEFWLGPIMKLPKLLAIIWGAITIIIGRVLGGEARRGLMFLMKSVLRRKK